MPYFFKIWIRELCQLINNFISIRRICSFKIRVRHLLRISRTWFLSHQSNRRLFSLKLRMMIMLMVWCYCLRKCSLTIHRSWLWTARIVNILPILVKSMRFILFFNSGVFLLLLSLFLYSISWSWMIRLR